MIKFDGSNYAVTGNVIISLQGISICAVLTLQNGKYPDVYAQIILRIRKIVTIIHYLLVVALECIKDMNL